MGIFCSGCSRHPLLNLQVPKDVHRRKKMSVQVRLQRHGNKNHPFYHIVASDHRKARDSRFIEKLGVYDPKGEPSMVKMDAERIQYWYGKGAQLSNTVAVLAKSQGLKFERLKTAPKKSKTK